MTQNILSSLISLSQLVSNASSQRSQPLTPQQIEHVLAAAKVQIEALSQALRSQLEAPTAQRVPIETQLTQIKELPPQIVQNSPELLALAKQIPSLTQGKTAFFEVSFQTPSGQDLIKVTLPDVIAKTLTSQNNYQLVFQSGTPPRLSQLSLINSPTLQGIQTPLDVNPLVAKNELLPLQNNSYVQAFSLPTTAPTTSGQTSPLSNAQGGDKLILHVLTVSDPAPATTSSGSTQQKTLLDQPLLRQQLEKFVPFLKKTTFGQTQQTTKIGATPHLSPSLNQTSSPSTKSAIPTQTPQTAKTTSSPNIIQVGTHSVNLQAPLNQQAPIQKGRVIGHFQNAPIIELSTQTATGQNARPQSASSQLLILTNTRLNIGQEISLRVLKPQATLETALQPQTNAIHSPLNAQETAPKWESFEKILLALETLAPELSPLVQSQIPSPGKQSPAQLSTSLLFFIKALQLKAPAENWLPQTLSQTLQNEQLRLPLQALEQDFEQLIRVVRDSATGQEFQRFTLPLQTDDALQPFYIFMRPFSEENKYQHSDAHNKDDMTLKDKKKKEVRFLLNVNLSHMGAVQLDGLFKHKNLNMILRLKEPLSPKIQNELITRYTSVLETLGLEGVMRFQGAHEWVNFEDDSLKMEKIDI